MASRFEALTMREYHAVHPVAIGANSKMMHSLGLSCDNYVPGSIRLA